MHQGHHLVALLTLGLLLAAAANHVQGESVSLKAVCGNQFVSLGSISETRKLIQENEKNPVESCARYKESMSDLDGILGAFQTGHICNLQLVDRIRQYHLKYIDSSSRDNSKQRDGISKSLKHFFISLCFQISAECKINLINNLQWDIEGVIVDEDYEQIKRLEAANLTLGDEDETINDFDDVLLLNDLSEATQMEQGDRETLLAIKVKTIGQLRALLDVCETKFKPFYDKLIMPLIRLSNLGYNYLGELLEKELEELRTNKLMKRWYDIVQICEAYRTIKIFEDVDKVTDQEGDARRMITFITDEEVAHLEEHNMKSLDEQLALEKTTDGATKAVYEYSPPPVYNTEELWIKDQEELEQLVKHHEARKTESDRVQKRLMNKVLSKMWWMVKNAGAMMLMSELNQCRHDSCQQTTRSNINEDLLMMLDEAVAMEEFDQGTAVEPSDKPVAAQFSITSRKGPDSRAMGSRLPERVRLMPRYRDGNKTSKKIFRYGLSWVPRWLKSKWSLCMGIMAVCTVFMLVILVAGGGG